MSIAINSSTNFTNSVEGKNMTKGSEQGEDLSVEFNQLLSNLVSSDDKNVLNLDNELMNWFNELTDMEQQVIYDIFYSSLTENTTSLVEMQNFISHPTFQSIQSIDLLENQNRMQKLFDFLGKNQTKIESFMQNLSDEEIQNFLLSAQKSNNHSFNNTDKSSDILQKTFFDFQKDFSLNVNLSSNNDQFINESSLTGEKEVKMIDLNQVQMNFSSNNLNNILNKTDSTVLNQNFQNLHVDKNFTEEFGKILMKNVKLPNGESQMNIQLQPKELGQMSVKLTSQEGVISAQIIVQSAVGKELLDSQLHQLKQSLVFQGYQVDKIEVQQVSSSSNSQNLNSEFDFSREQSTSQQENKKNLFNYSDTFNEDEDEFISELSNMSGIDYTI